MNDRLITRIAKNLQSKSLYAKVSNKSGVSKLLNSRVNFNNSPVPLIGQAKINQLILSNITKLKNLMVDQVSNLSEELGISELETGNPVINVPAHCLEPKKTAELLVKLNNLLTVLENTSTILNITSIGLNTLTRVLNGTITAVNALTLVKIGVNQATKALPFTPGVVTSLVVDIGDGLQIIKEKLDGTPRLPQIKNALTTGTSYITIAAVMMGTIVTLLTMIIEVLKSCGEEPNELGDQTKEFLKQSQTIQENNTYPPYNGFTFKIVNQLLPNDPTVTRRIAQAINTEGIVAIETEPSFTGNPKVLVEELKLIIDRDNLKAY